LRGWPAPLGAAIVTANPVFDANGDCLSPNVEAQLRLIAQQVFDFAVSHRQAGRLSRPANSSTELTDIEAI
jgi:FMN reductase